MSISDDGIEISMSKCIGSDVGLKDSDKKSKGCPPLGLRCECESAGLRVFRPVRVSQKLKNTLYAY